MKVLRDLLILVLFFSLCWWLFSIWRPFDDPDQVELVSLEHEEKLADLILDQMIEDPSWKENHSYADTALQKISSRLLDSLGLTDYDYKFYLIESSTINAFALPGGNIVVFTGLMEFADSPEEVTSVLAHEIGHVEKRHVVDRLIQEFSLAILIGAFGGGDAILLKDILNTLIKSKFSRGQEEEADNFGLELLERSNIEPSHMGSFFKKLDRNSSDLDEHLELIMSHPALNSRVKKAYQYELSPDFVQIDLDVDWDKVSSVLNSNSSEQAL